MRSFGIVQSFDAYRGEGLIVSKLLTRPASFHRSQLVDRSHVALVRPGCLLEFSLAISRRGPIALEIAPVDPEDRYLGIVKAVHDSRRFGFLIRDDSTEDVFFSMGAVTSGARIDAGSIVQFSVAEHAGGIVASDIVPFGHSSDSGALESLVPLLLSERFVLEASASTLNLTFGHLLRLLRDLPAVDQAARDRISSWPQATLSRYATHLSPPYRSRLQSLLGQPLVPSCSHGFELPELPSAPPGIGVAGPPSSDLLEQLARSSFQPTGEAPESYRPPATGDHAHHQRRVQVPNTPPEDRLATALGCLTSILSPAPGLPSVSADILRDALLMSYAARAELRSRDASDDALHDHIRWLWVHNFWDGTSLFSTATVFRRNIIYRAILSAHLGTKPTVPLNVLVGSVLSAGNSPCAITLLSTLHQVSLNSYLDFLALGHSLVQTPNHQRSLTELSELFDIPFGDMILAGGSDFWTRSISSTMIARALNVDGYSDPVQKGILAAASDTGRAVALAREANDPVLRLNWLSQAIRHTRTLSELFSSDTGVTLSAPIARSIGDLLSVLEAAQFQVRVSPVNLEVQIPDELFIDNPESDSPEPRDHLTVMRVLIANPSALRISGVALGLKLNKIEAKTSRAVDIRPDGNAVIEATCQLELSDDPVSLSYSVSAPDALPLVGSGDLRLRPAADWPPIPNLYQLDPVSDRYRLMFTGRRRILGRLHQRIRSGGSVMVFGVRRIGKTSILQQLRRELEKAGTVVVYCDARRCSEQIRKDDVAGVEAYICVELARAARVVEQHTVHGRSIVDFIRNLTADHKVVLLLDEADMILAHAAGRQLPAEHDPWLDFFSRLGSLPSEAHGQFSLILAGHYRLGTERAFLSRYLWCLKDLLPLPVGFFTHEELTEYAASKIGRPYIEEHYEDLVTMLGATSEAFGWASYTTRALDSLPRLTANHPYYLTLVLRELVDVLNRKTQRLITEDDLRDAVAHAVEIDSHVMTLWSGDFWTPEQFAPAHKQILRRLVALLGSYTDIPDSHTVGLTPDEAGLSATVFNSAIEDLLGLAVIERAANGYRFKADLMRLILLQHITT